MQRSRDPVHPLVAADDFERGAAEEGEGGKELRYRCDDRRGFRDNFVFAIGRKDLNDGENG
jgi:hypothetical protein